MKAHHRLKVWERSIELVEQIYKLTERFPKEELYGLTTQMRRSAISIPSNIAEGFKRYHNKEFKQFLHIAQGSAAELETQLIIAKELKFINQATLENISIKIDSLNKMISSLMNKLKTQY